MSTKASKRDDFGCVDTSVAHVAKATPGEPSVVVFHELSRRPTGELWFRWSWFAVSRSTRRIGPWQQEHPHGAGDAEDVE
jgi:hypothetical protein